MSDNLENEIAQNAQGPKRSKVDAVEVEQHDLGDQPRNSFRSSLGAGCHLWCGFGACSGFLVKNFF